MKVQIPDAFQELFIPSRNKAFFGGRGSAKSHSFASALLIRAAENPLRILCAREIQKSIKDSVKRLLDDKMKAIGLDEFYTSTETEIRGANSSLFIFAGMRSNPDSIKSIEGIDIAWVEEAHKASQRSLDILIPTVRGMGSELWYSWNPYKASDPVDKMFRGEYPPPDSIIKEVSFADNPWFPEVLKEDMEWDQIRDPEKYQHIWKGAYVLRTEARVFKNWRVEAFETPKDVSRFYYGGDWGFSVDPSVLVRCFIIDRTLYIDYEAYKVGCEIDYLPALFAGSDINDPPRWENPQGFPGIQDATKWPIRADSSRPETISYMRKRGFQIRGARKGAGSVEDGISFLGNYDIVIHPRCVHTVDEMTMYSYKVDPQTDEVLPILEDKKNHVIDSLRYAVEELRRSIGKMMGGLQISGGKTDN